MQGDADSALIADLYVNYLFEIADAAGFFRKVRGFCYRNDLCFVAEEGTNIENWTNLLSELFLEVSDGKIRTTKEYGSQLDFLDLANQNRRREFHFSTVHEATNEHHIRQ